MARKNLLAKNFSKICIYRDFIFYFIEHDTSDTTIQLVACSESKGGLTLSPHCI